MERAVARGLAARPASVPARVGVDEKAAGRGQDHIAVVSNLDAGAVEYLADERRQASLDGFRARFSTEQGRGCGSRRWRWPAASTLATLMLAAEAPQTPL